ncbi:F-box/kelch-repeat protein [Senna tora]|uniref:F-box/kelch-repeat protein n=1 Tax=Senna tora TaxID=362788 RepID=A0A835CEA1_9FABA|nr:F-box/kelch-repeat protein [Senna tora]
MDEMFLNKVSIPSDLTCKIIAMMPAEDMHMIPYVSKNWFRTCKKSLFITENSMESRLNKHKHIFFCVPLGRRNVPVFFIQVDPLAARERFVEIFKKLPTFFFAHEEIHYVANDKGVICFCTKRVNAVENFQMWNPVTGQSVTVSPPAVIDIGSLIRSGFSFDNNLGKYGIILMWSLLDDPNISLVSIFSSNNRTWSDVSECVYDANLLFDASITINGHIFWLSTKKDNNFDDCHSSYCKLLGESLPGSIRIDETPSPLRFLDFAGDHLVIITEKIGVHEDDKEMVAQGFVLFECEEEGIIRLMNNPIKNPFMVKKMFSYYPTIRIV